jgi:hypothetical protein
VQIAPDLLCPHPASSTLHVSHVMLVKERYSISLSDHVGTELVVGVPLFPLLFV